MARQGGGVQLEQSDIRLLMNMAKMAKSGFLRATIEETQYAIKKHRADVREVKMWGFEFPGHKKVLAANRKTPGIDLSEPIRWLSSLPKWHSEESPDMLEVQRYACFCTSPTQPSDTKVDAISAQNAISTWNAISAWHGSCATLSHSGHSNIATRQFARHRCGFMCFSSQKLKVSISMH